MMKCHTNSNKTVKHKSAHVKVYILIYLNINIGTLELNQSIFLKIHLLKTYPHMCMNAPQRHPYPNLTPENKELLSILPDQASY